MTNFEKLDGELLITQKVRERADWKDELNNLPDGLTEEIIAAATTNYERLRALGLTTELVEENQGFKDALNDLNPALVDEIIIAASEVRGFGGIDAA